LASQQELLRQSLLLQANSLQLQIKSAEQRILGQQKNVEQATRAYEIANIRYKSGLGSQIEISDSDVALRQARLNKAQAIHDYKVAVAELKVLIGSVNPRYFDYKK
jgi:outer membrane protein TolC